MTTDEIRKALERFTYKSGWEFKVGDHPREGQLLRIEFDAENSYEPGYLTPIGISVWIPPLDTLHDFWSWLFWRIKRIEVHELCEFFKIDGKTWEDPHDEDDPWDRVKELTDE